MAVADPCTIVIFGASGDLTRRKLIPALYELADCQSLASRFAIIGFARSEMSDAAFQHSVRGCGPRQSRHLSGQRMKFFAASRSPLLT